MTTPALDIPRNAPSVEASYATTHVRAEITPTDPKFAFDLLVPKTWALSREFGPVTQMLLQPEGLGFFAASAERGAPVIAVTATRCPFEVRVDGWARLSIAREGWSIVDATWFPGPNGLFFDVTATRTVDGLDFVRRSSFRIAAGALIAVNCMCAREQWDAVKESFWAAHVTFALLEPGPPNLEHWLRAKAVDPGFETVHPASWEAEPAKSDLETRSGLHLRLVDAKRETLLAYMLVKAERYIYEEPPALVQLVRDTADMLEASGIMFASGPQPLPDEEDPRARAVEGSLGSFVARARMGTAEVDVRLGFVRRSKLTFTLAVCHPSVEDDPIVALRAQRAFEIVRAGLQPTTAPGPAGRVTRP